MALLKSNEGANFWTSAALAAGAIGIAALLWPSDAASDQRTLESAPSEYDRSDNGDDTTPEVRQFNEERRSRNRRGMQTLLGWSILNIGTSAAGVVLADGRQRHFHEMNAAWNVVNAAIAGFGWYNATTEDPDPSDRYDALASSHNLEKVFLFNMGLNVSYIATGAYLWERGLRTESQRLQGWGPSVIVQGAFLLVFDSAMYWLTRNQRRDFEISAGPRLEDPGVAVQLRF